jgi:hypothetical protein
MRLLGLGVLLLLVVAIGAASAVVLAVSSLLARLFAVTTFEASIVVVGVAIVLGIWLGLAVPADENPAPDAEDEQPVVILDALPIPTRRGPRRRKR